MSDDNMMGNALTTRENLVNDIKVKIEEYLLGHSVKDIAEAIGVTPSAIYGYRSGTQGLLPSKMQKLCQLIGCPELGQKLQVISNNEKIAQFRKENEAEAEFFTQQFRNLNGENRKVVMALVTRLIKEECMRRKERDLHEKRERLNQAVWQKYLKTYGGRKNDKIIILDSICCMGQEWISWRFGLSDKVIDEIVRGEYQLNPDQRIELLLTNYLSGVDAGVDGFSYDLRYMSMPHRQSENR